MEGVERS